MLPRRSPTTCVTLVERDPDDSEFVYRTATRAKALDAVRGMLPAAATSNVGIYGTGQALRGAAAADALQPASRGARVRRPDAARTPQGHPELPAARRPPRSRWPLERVPRRRPGPTRRRSSQSLFGSTPVDAAAEVELVDFDPDAEDKILAAICYPHASLPEAQLLDRVRQLGVDERVALMRGVRRATGRIGATSRAGPSSAASTASTCSATTARSATCSVTGC